MKSIHADISKRLKEFRESKNLSQKKIAEILDITEKQYSNIECGKSGLSLDKIFELNKTLGLDPTYLITGRKNPSTVLYDFTKDCPQDKIFDLEQMIRYASNLYRNEGNRKW